MALVEYGNFSAAARNIHISQPALTAAIKALERQFKCELIIRGTKPLRLTEAGQKLYAAASRIRLELNNLDSQLSMLRKGQLLQTNVGAIDSIAMLLLDNTHSETPMAIHVDNSSRLIEGVNLDKLDFAFITTPLAETWNGLLHEDVGAEIFRLVSHPKLVERIKGVLAQQRLEAFVTYNPESTTLQRILVTATTLDIRLEISFASTSPELIREMVKREKGAALLPLSLIQEDLQRGELQVIPGRLNEFKRPISLVYRSGKYLNQNQQAIINFIRSKLT